MREVVLIDLSSVAVPIWKMSGGNPDTNHCKNEIVATVRRLSHAQPSVAVCCDSGKSFRHEVSPAYKANRPETDAPMVHQFRLAQDELRADGFPVWSAKGFEADDIIASATRHYLQRDAETAVLIVTGDKDIHALISPRVRIKSRNGFVDEAGCVEKFKVRPDQILDYLCLCGDASDNIKGAKGIGEKTAAELLTAFGSLTELYKDFEGKVGGEGLSVLAERCETPIVDTSTGRAKRCAKCAVCASQAPFFASAKEINITPAVAMSLAEFAERLDEVRQLVTLRTDVDIPFDEVFIPRVPKHVAEFNPEADYPAEDGEDAMPEQDQPQGQEAAGDTTVVTGTIEAAEAPAAPTDAEKPAPAPVTALVPRTGEILPAYEQRMLPRDLREARIIAKDIHDAHLFSAFGSPQAVLTAVMLGSEFGMPPVASLRGVHIIEGKPSMSAGLMAAVVMKSGLAEYFEPVEIGPESVTFETKRKNARNPLRVTHTIAMAKQAWNKGKTDAEREASWKASGWGRNPTDMLVARCQSRLARYAYPDLLAGMYSPEELREIGDSDEAQAS